MLSKLLLVSTIILNSCTNQKMHLAEHQKEHVSIKYQAFSRGFFQEILVSEKHIIFYDDREYKNAKTHKISKKEWEEFMRLLSAIELKALPKLKAPTAKRLYDGAPHATLTIEKKEKQPHPVLLTTATLQNNLKLWSIICYPLKNNSKTTRGAIGRLFFNC